MADELKFKYGTDAEILALLPTDTAWENRAFYYPSDKDWFYQALDGVMKKYAGGEGFGVGAKINGAVIGAIKIAIRPGEFLVIPEDYDYNTFMLSNYNSIENNGRINIM